MCWTNSDLIIGLAPSAPVANLMCAASVRRRRVPNGHQTVKVEPVDGLHRSPVPEALGKATESNGIEQPDRPSVQERQVAEPRVEPVVAHRGLRIDALFLGKPVD